MNGSECSRKKRMRRQRRRKRRKKKRGVHACWNEWWDQRKGMKGQLRKPPPAYDYLPPVDYDYVPAPGPGVAVVAPETDIDIGY